MSEVKIHQLKGATFAARGTSNHWVMMDGKEKVGGAGAASGPMEMVLFGLGGCTAIDVEMMIKKMRIPLDNFEIDINSVRAEEHPKVYTNIDMTYHFYGKDLPRKKLEKAVSLSKNVYCSVSAMLEKTAKITTNVVIHESE